MANTQPTVAQEKAFEQIAAFAPEYEHVPAEWICGQDGLDLCSQTVETAALISVQPAATQILVFAGAGQLKEAPAGSATQTLDQHA